MQSAKVTQSSCSSKKFANTTATVHHESTNLIEMHVDDRLESLVVNQCYSWLVLFLQIAWCTICLIDGVACAFFRFPFNTYDLWFLMHALLCFTVVLYELVPSHKKPNPSIL